MSAEQQVKVVQNKMYQNRGLIEGIEKLYLNPKAADVHFKFGSGDRVPAHKNLLFVVSKVFDAMFYGDLKETDDIEITDSSAAAFKEFLQFFYLNEIELTIENIGEVMYLVQKYNISNGIDVCEEFLKDTLAADNVCVVLNIAMLYEHKELIKLCEKIIILDTNAVFDSAGFLECEGMALNHILKMDLLSCPEVKVFEACMHWVKAKSNQDVVTKELVDVHLGKSFYEVRFASMTMQELCTLPTEYDAVLADDYKVITKIISIPGYNSEKFNTCPRIPKWNEAASIKCDRVLSDENEWIGKGSRSRVSFSSTKLLLLGGFECFPLSLLDDGVHVDLEWDLSADVIITEETTVGDEDAKVLLEMKANLGSKNNSVSLPQPLLIRPGFFYTICMEKFPSGHFFHNKKLKKEVQISSNTIINFNNRGFSANFFPSLNFNNVF